MREILLELLNRIIDSLLPICATLLTTASIYVGTKINNYFKSKKIDKIIPYVVKYVEQVYIDIHGQDKFEKAVTMATTLLEENGIIVSDDELEVMIESACYELKLSLTK